ncbi:MAG: hypothetical protein V4485_02325, partial [Pseudomonadota bacterium]
LTSDDRAKVFVEAIGGSWGETEKIKSILLEPGSIKAFNLEKADVKKKYKILTESIKCLISMPKDQPKFLVIDNMEQILDDARLDNSIASDLELLQKNNAIVLCSINLSKFQNLHSLPRFQSLLLSEWSQIILPGEYKDLDIKALAGISEVEEKVLKSFSLLSRLCILKQDNRSVAVELSLGGKPGVLKMLSCSEKDIKLFSQEKERDPENWVLNLYEAFANNMRAD